MINVAKAVVMLSSCDRYRRGSGGFCGRWVGSGGSVSWLEMSALASSGDGESDRGFV